MSESMQPTYAACTPLLANSTVQTAPAQLPPLRMPSADLWRAHLEATRVPTPLLLEWEGIGCQYNTPSGFKTVLQVCSGRGKRSWLCMHCMTGQTQSSGLLHVAQNDLSDPVQETASSCSVDAEMCGWWFSCLQDVSGAARPYEMLALMGPSGAGDSCMRHSSYACMHA